MKGLHVPKATAKTVLIPSKEVLSWFGNVGRELPWRKSRDPWEILVSEFMLQQTQVARVVKKWPEFLQSFPTPEACAKSSLAEVIQHWSGLGYNRRAVHLHQCANRATKMFGGDIPNAFNELQEFPGIGPYTARAIRVFAFGCDDAVLDTNVARILARVAGKSLSREEAQRSADNLVPSGKGWEWNQALLDIGATCCTARQPDCHSCPLFRHCQWKGGDEFSDDPAVGSGGVSKPQSKFVDSDRRGRGRLVSKLRSGPVRKSDLAEVMGWPADKTRAQTVAEKVVADGLACNDGDWLHLPDK